ncbi:hypothetical protein IIA16_03860, partial [bacterium]|nr:hypothetical protein [bacterium]
AQWHYPFENKSIDTDGRFASITVEVVPHPGSVFTVWTHVRLAVEDDLFGNLGGLEELEITHPGGLYQGIYMEIPGHPEFSVGQRYVLFLWDESRPWFTPVVGFNQGAFRVIRDAEGVERVFNSHGAFPVKGFGWETAAEASIANVAPGSPVEDVVIGWPGEPALDLDSFVTKLTGIIQRLKEEIQ